VTIRARRDDSAVVPAPSFRGARALRGLSGLTYECAGSSPITPGQRPAHHERKFHRKTGRLRDVSRPPFLALSQAFMIRKPSAGAVGSMMWRQSHDLACATCNFGKIM